MVQNVDFQTKIYLWRSAHLWTLCSIRQMCFNQGSLWQFNHMYSIEAERFNNYCYLPKRIVFNFSLCICSMLHCLANKHKIENFALKSQPDFCDLSASFASKLKSEAEHWYCCSDVSKYFVCFFSIFAISEW